MTPIDPQVRAKLIDALDRSDAQTREARADRIIWMGQHNSLPSIIVGNDETLAVMAEARVAFREGHFISVILLGLAVVEHELAEDLIGRDLASFGVSLQKAIALAREHRILNSGLLDRVERLRLVRNPFVHRKPPGHPHTPWNRREEQRLHPASLLEADAKEAFEVMFLVFCALLREMPPPGSG